MISPSYLPLNQVVWLDASWIEDTTQRTCLLQFTQTFSEVANPVTKKLVHALKVKQVVIVKSMFYCQAFMNSSFLICKTEENYSIYENLGTACLCDLGSWSHAVCRNTRNYAELLALKVSEYHVCDLQHVDRINVLPNQALLYHANISIWKNIFWHFGAKQNLFTEMDNCSSFGELYVLCIIDL